MPIYPGPDIITFKTQFYHADSGNLWSTSTFWHAASQQATQANINAVCAAYHSQFATVVKPMLHEKAIISVTIGRVYNSTNLVEGSGGSDVAGDITEGDMLPLQDALVIQRKTSVFGRTNQGRIFISGIGEDVQANGRITDDYTAAAKGIATFLGADRTFVQPYNARHWSRKTNTFQAIRVCNAVRWLKSRRDRQEVRGSPIIA